MVNKMVNKMIVNTFLVSVLPLLKDVSDIKANVIFFVVLMFLCKNLIDCGFMVMIRSGTPRIFDFTME